MPLKLSNLKQKPSTHQNVRFEFEAIGTLWDVKFEISNKSLDINLLAKEIEATIELFDANYSRFRSDSRVVSEFSSPGDYILPEDAEPLFDLYDSLYKLTDGQMTPLIGQLLVDAGYDADYSLKSEILRDVPRWDKALDYAYPKLRVKETLLLDFGAAGKGYLVDEIAAVIRSFFVEEFTINAGGDIVHSTASKQITAIGLEHPDLNDQVIGIAHISGSALCGSAGNRRVWESFTHILSPTRKASPHHIRAIWVVADSALVADGLTTALYFTDPESLLEHYSFEYAILQEDYSLEHSSNFPAEFFIKKDKE